MPLLKPLDILSHWLAALAFCYNYRSLLGEATRSAVDFITALPITTTRASILTLLPVFLLLSVVLLAFSYRRIQSKSNGYDEKVFAKLTTIHAFATEGIQLFLAAVGTFSTYFWMTTTQDILLKKSTLPYFTVWALTAALAVCVAVLHVVAIYAVDLIEGRVLLGRWTHPHAWRPFAITRKWMFGRSSKGVSTAKRIIRKQNQVTVKRSHSMSDPGTKNESKAFERREDAAPKRLEYLDLAYPIEPVQLGASLLYLPLDMECRPRRHPLSPFSSLVSTSTSETLCDRRSNSASTSPLDLETLYDSCSASELSLTLQLPPSPPDSADAADGDEKIDLIE